MKLFILIMGWYSGLLLAACPDMDTLQATYEITLSDKKNSTSQLVLSRHGQWVAHQYPKQKITETWLRTAHGRLKKTRYFEHFHRAIEYAPGETIQGKRPLSWAMRYQLVEPALLAQLTKVHSETLECDTVETYQGVVDGEQVELSWMAGSHLVKYFIKQQGARQIRWRLVDVEYDQAKVTRYKRELESYQTTDFADIGDDHTDPFLTDMVHQGFIEHGSDGVYHAPHNH